MKKKLKWLVNIATLCLCACLAAIGVYAAKNATITAGGTISFSATNIFADVECEVLNAKETVTFTKITIDATKTDETFTDNTTWAKNLEFAEDGRDITIKFTITNLATDRPLYAKITNTTNATNLNVNNGEDKFVETGWLELTAQTAGAEENKTVLVITMSIANKDAAVTGNYGFNIDLKNEKTIVAALDYDFDKTNLTASAKMVDIEATFGDVVIPSTVTDEEGNTYTVTGIADYAFVDFEKFADLVMNQNMEMAEAANLCTPKITSVKIPSTVEYLGDMAFFGIASLKTLVIDKVPETVRASDTFGLFMGSGLTSVTINSGVIASYMFNGCSELTDVTMGEGVTIIGSYAFSQCESLTSVTIPDSVKEIGMDAFFNCEKLTTITIKATTPPVLGGWDTIPESVTKIYVPIGCKANYIDNNSWKDYENIIEEIEFA